MTRIYVTGIRTGKCRVCGTCKDLRCGACFDCANKVSGNSLPGGHYLWETDNPSNDWYYIEDEKTFKTGQIK